MKKLGSVILFVVAASMTLSTIAVFAQASMSSWPFFVEVTPRAGAPGIYDLVVPSQVMDKSREDLADLRLYDARGKEIPYALAFGKKLMRNERSAHACSIKRALAR